MQESNKPIKIADGGKVKDIKNIMVLTLIILPLMSFTFYTIPIVIGQEKQPYNTPKDILICQMAQYMESPNGSNIQQVDNICSYQSSIGYNQSISELCYIFSGRSIDIINAFCDKTIVT